MCAVVPAVQRLLLRGRESVQASEELCAYCADTVRLLRTHGCWERRARSTQRRWTARPGQARSCPAVEGVLPPQASARALRAHSPRRVPCCLASAANEFAAERPRAAEIRRRVPRR